MSRFKKKPVVIDAYKYNPDAESMIAPDWFIKAVVEGVIVPKVDDTLVIKTNTGEALANAGDYIIKGLAGEIYPCPQAIFELSYEDANVQVSQKEVLHQAVATLEQFANQLRMMEEPDQLLDGAFLSDCVPEMYNIVKRNNP